MNIYKWGFDPNLQVVSTADSDAFRLLTPYVDAVKRSGLLLKVVDPGPGEAEVEVVGDFMSVGVPQPIVLNQRAMDVLGDVLKAGGTVVPVKVSGHDGLYYCFSTDDSVDIVDMSRSEVLFTPYTKMIRKAVLKTGFDLAGRDVFVAKGFEKHDVFVTQKVVDAVEAAGLVGSCFIKFG